MSLDFDLVALRKVRVGSFNITHNLGKMAVEAGIYDALWRPDENGFKHASEIIAPLEAGLAVLKADPRRFKKFDDSNGWGTYRQFVPFVEEVLEACKANPDAEIEVSR